MKSSSWMRRSLASIHARIGGPARWQDAAALAGFGGVLRLLCVWWAVGKFPPAADGQFYDVVARRIAQGLGYTWLWPDGAVTYAAHYPVGYPALMGGLYALFGANAAWAMLFNAVLGTLAVAATYYLAVRVSGRPGGMLAAFATAVSPSLVLYTPALMTEGVTAALYGIAAHLSVVAARSRGVNMVVMLGLVLGAATLVRPQTLLLVPVFGAAAYWSGEASGSALPRPGPSVAQRWWFRAALATFTCLAVCAPWTLRNCDKLERCVFVSANGGWNLLIGTEPRANGGWIALTEMGVPPECREVFEEAAKDACFGRAALGRIASRPLDWLSLVPKKWSATFDYPGAPAHYLRMSNSAVIDAATEQRLLALETAWQRLLLALALVGFARFPGAGRRFRMACAGIGLGGLCTPLGWPSVICLIVLAGFSWCTLLRERALALAVSVLGATLFMHSVFFGAGRYALVCGYLAGVLAATLLRDDTSAAGDGKAAARDPLSA